MPEETRGAWARQVAEDYRAYADRVFPEASQGREAVLNEARKFEAIADRMDRAEAETPKVERVDKYTITINEHRVRATEDQEQQIRALDAEQLGRFLKVMGVGDE